MGSGCPITQMRENLKARVVWCPFDTKRRGVVQEIRWNTVFSMSYSISITTGIFQRGTQS